MESDPKDILTDQGHSKHIFFERLSMDGLEEMHAYSVDERMYEHLGFDAFKEISETEEYIKKLLDRVEEGNAAYWFVRRSSDNKLIGTAGLLRLEFQNQSIEWGFGIDPDLWGEGYIFQIMEALKKYVFEELQLNRLYGTTFITNERTISSLKATGMQNEGILREFSIKNGQHIDGWKYSMLKSEYFADNNGAYNEVENKFDEEFIIKIISGVLSSKDINEETDMANTKKWDSLNHMAIIIELTQKTKKNLTPKQIAEATSVKNILEILNSENQ